MNKKNDLDVDAVLNELRASPMNDSFSSTEEFKKAFFNKAEKVPTVRLHHPLWVALRFTTSIAAVFLIVVGGFFLYDNGGGNKNGDIVCQMVMTEVPELEDESAPAPVVNEADPQAVVMPSSTKSTIVSLSRHAARRGKRTVKAKMAVAETYDAMCAVECEEPPELCESITPIQPDFNTEEYKSVTANPFLSAKEQSLSTFGADVDTASYTNARRYLLQENTLPPKDAVRIEEFVNTFSYDYAPPATGKKFGTTFEMMACPWAKEHQLLLIGLQAQKTDITNLPQSNFVFLVDDSGSMYDSMELVIEAMTLLTKQLRAGDTVSLVTYGGQVRILLDGAKASDQEKIVTKLQKLKAGGYTPGGAGIVEAYKLAEKHFIKKGNNRIVLITDGDFNVGASSELDLVKMIEEKRKSEVYLSIFGVGQGNYKDNKLKMLANKGNGNYTYLDNIREAKNAMVNEFSGGMFVLARDVKLQVEFNPNKVYAYRLLGYELRKMENRDFRDDTKDAGEVGVGHQVTALYELVPADVAEEVKTKVLPQEQALKYQTVSAIASEEILTFRLRYRDIEGDAPVTEREFVFKTPPATTDNLAWASCAAEFALLLQDSPYKGDANYETLRKRAIKLLGEDENGARAEFLTLIRVAKEMISSD